MKKKGKNKGKWDLVLYNDPMHSFEYVVETLIECIPHMNRDKAVRHAMMIHKNQRTTIFRGEHEHVEHFAGMIENYEYEQRGKLRLPNLATEIKETDA